jgi:hypothetical protein
VPGPADIHAQVVGMVGDDQQRAARAHGRGQAVVQRLQFGPASRASPGGRPATWATSCGFGCPLHSRSAER